jgi:hypothetical protein
MYAGETCRNASIPFLRKCDRTAERRRRNIS